MSSAKILYLLKKFPRLSETFILNEIMELERNDVKVIIFSLKQPNEEYVQPAASAVQAQIHVLPDGWRRMTSLLPAHAVCLFQSPLRYLRTLYFVMGRKTPTAWRKFLAAPYIVRLARRSGVGHFHAHFASGPARQAKLASMLSGIPFSFTAHAKDLFWSGHQHGKNNKLKKRVRMASFVIAISDYNREFIHSLNFKVPRKRVVTLHNGLDLREWRFLRPDGRPSPLNGPSNPPLLLGVGRLVPKKGFHVLIEACGLLREQGRPFRCAIAGEGPGRNDLTEQIRALKLEEYVELLGAVPQDRLKADVYPRASILVQPSIIAADGDQDGIPTVIIEALAVGLPVVSTPISGIAETVIDGETGLLVRPGYARGLANAVVMLLDEPVLAARVAGGGRRLVERRFDLRNNVRVLVHLFETAAGGMAPRWSLATLRMRAGLDPLPADPNDPAGESGC